MSDETPVVGDGIVDLQGDNEMAEQLTEPGNLSIAMTAMATEFGAAAARRVNASDQLSEDSQRMWTIAMTSPTTMAALGLRTALESGSGRTRVEANRPAETGGAAPG